MLVKPKQQQSQRTIESKLKTKIKSLFEKYYLKKFNAENVIIIFNSLFDHKNNKSNTIRASLRFRFTGENILKKNQEINNLIKLNSICEEVIKKTFKRITNNNDEEPEELMIWSNEQYKSDDDLINNIYESTN